MVHAVLLHLRLTLSYIGRGAGDPWTQSCPHLVRRYSPQRPLGRQVRQPDSMCPLHVFRPQEAPRRGPEASITHVHGELRAVGQAAGTGAQGG